MDNKCISGRFACEYLRQSVEDHGFILSYCAQYNEYMETTDDENAVKCKKCMEE